MSMPTSGQPWGCPSPEDSDRSGGKVPRCLYETRSPGGPGLEEVPAAYLTTLPEPLQARLVELVYGVADLSVGEKDEVSTLLLETAKKVLAKDPEAPVVVPIGLLVQVVHEVWARSVFPKRDVVESPVENEVP